MGYYMCKNKRTCTQFLFCTFCIFKVSYVLTLIYTPQRDSQSSLLVIHGLQQSSEIRTHITPIHPYSWGCKTGQSSGLILVLTVNTSFWGPFSSMLWTLFCAFLGRGGVPPTSAEVLSNGPKHKEAVTHLSERMCMSAWDSAVACGVGVNASSLLNRMPLIKTHKIKMHLDGVDEML